MRDSRAVTDPFVLDPHAPSEVTRFLRENGWIAPSRRVTAIERAGEGNMNLTVRAQFDDGSTLILKQSRGYVEKYPQIAAPAERILTEIAFYRAVAPWVELATHMPELLHFSAADRIACFEDLGAAADMTETYGGHGVAHDDLAVLVAWLCRLHRLALDPRIWGAPLANRAMRALNHEHIFVLPLDGARAPAADGFSPGLGVLADPLRSDRDYRAAIERLGEMYLADGTTLIHGDFYPGSWLRHATGLKVIDPEFGHFGRAEFDVGVLLAHLVFSGWDASRAVATLHDTYDAAADFDWSSARGFAGAELMRRVLGVAQLPLRATLEQKASWLDMSREFLLGRGPA